jgi:hypothetical protein
LQEAFSWDNSLAVKTEASIEASVMPSRAVSRVRLLALGPPRHDGRARLLAAASL